MVLDQMHKQTICTLHFLIQAYKYTHVLFYIFFLFLIECKIPHCYYCNILV